MRLETQLIGECFWSCCLRYFLALIWEAAVVFFMLVAKMEWNSIVTECVSISNVQGLFNFGVVPITLLLSSYGLIHTAWVGVFTESLVSMNLQPSASPAEHMGAGVVGRIKAGSLPISCQIYSPPFCLFSCEIQGWSEKASPVAIENSIPDFLLLTWHLRTYVVEEKKVGAI